MKEDYGRIDAHLYHNHWWWRSRGHPVENAPQLSFAGRVEILDVGCGDGLFFPELANLGPYRASKSTHP